MSLLRLTSALVALLAFTAVPRIFAGAETGRLYTELFTSAQFGELNRTLGLAQDRAGILYAGNRNVVLAFDGQSWRSIPTAGRDSVALVQDAEDRIWSAALGWLEDDRQGGRVFRSLRDALPAGERTLGQFIDVQACTHGVYFMAEGALVRWHDGRATVMHGWTGIPQTQGDLIFANDAHGVLHSFDGETWRAFAPYPELQGKFLTSVVRTADGAWVLASASDGLFRIREGRVERFGRDLDPLLRQKGSHRLDRLRDGTIVVGLWSGGLAFLDPEGNLLHLLRTDPAGLPLSRVRGLVQDRTGDVWAALSTGVMRIDWPATFTRFDYSTGLPHTTVKRLTRLNGRLYAATSQGLYALEPAGTAPAARFVPVPGCAEQIWDFAPMGDALVLTGPNVHIVRPGQPPVQISTGGFSLSVLVPPGRTDLALIGTGHGLTWLRKRDDGWKLEPFPADFTASAGRLGLANDTLWIATTDGGYHCIPGFAAIVAGGPVQKIEHYPGGHGFASARLEGYPRLATSETTAWFADGGSVYRFDPATKRFVVQFNLVPSGDTAVPEALELGGNGDGLWLQVRFSNANLDSGASRHLLWHADTGLSVLPQAIFRSTGSAQAFFEEKTAAGRVAWIGGDEGLVRVELPAALVAPTAFRVVLRRADDLRGVSHSLAGGFRLPAGHAGLTVGFCTDRLDDSATRFQTKLEGRDEDWSAWERATNFTAAGLQPGNYVLHIRAQDSDRHLSAPATLTFTVLPAWWQTWWAFIAYGLVLAGAVAGLARWRGRAIRRRNIELEHLIATRTAELRTAKIGAEAANHAKSAFLANMSHELRTPLNAMLGFAQILQRASDVSPAHRQRLAVIGRNGDHLLQLINEVLDLSKIEAGKLSLSPRPIALLPLLNGLAETYAARAADRSLRFEAHFAAGLPARVEADDAKLRQVLHNLLGNAIKFTATGKIVFTVTTVEGSSPTAKPRVRFEVSDTGPGIDTAALLHVFEAFYQAADRRIAAQGTGLGLAISQRIVELMGARIEVESRVGEGARFWFDLPLPVLAADAPLREPTRTITGYAGPRRRLLVVDDETANRDVLRGMLEPLGFVIEEAPDGTAALARFAAANFDGVLLDIRMGGGPDGYVVARGLRLHAAGRPVAIIAVSASVFEEDRQTAIDAGCDAFLPKPFTEERLCEVLAEHLGLQWTYAAAAETPPTATVTPGALPAAELPVLLALAHRGDFDAFRERLAAIAAAQPDYAATVRHYDELAANFQLGALRQTLRSAGADTPEPRSP